MKFKEEVCGNCGLDLTTVEPTGVEKVSVGVKGEMVPYAECPQCHTNRVVVAPELAISPDPEPEPATRGGRRRAPEPEPEPSPAEPDVTPPEE